MNLNDILSARSINDTGFDNTTGNTSGRVLNKNGTTNVIKTGLTYFKRLSIFHTLIELRTIYFLLLVNVIFISVNILFAIIYMSLGPEALHTPTYSSNFDRFLHCFFFSTQTITTVGYGTISPVTPLANFIASFESLFGWIGSKRRI